MGSGAGSTTYVTEQPFDEALQSLRRVLAEADIKVAGELDMSNRFRESLLIGIGPCHLLLVTAAGGGFHELGEDPLLLAQTPLHVVASARGHQTEFHLLRLPATPALSNRPAAEAFRRLQARVTEAVERIAMVASFAL